MLPPGCAPIGMIVGHPSHFFVVKRKMNYDLINAGAERLQLLAIPGGPVLGIDAWIDFDHFLYENLFCGWCHLGYMTSRPCFEDRQIVGVAHALIDPV